MGLPPIDDAVDNQWIEMIPEKLGLTLAEFLSLDWEIDYVVGTMVFHGDSPADLLCKINGLVNFAVKLPTGLEW